MARGEHIYVHFTKFVHHGIDCGDGTIIHYDGEKVVQTSIATFGAVIHALSNITVTESLPSRKREVPEA
jgi:hypothetical protein